MWAAKAEIIDTPDPLGNKNFTIRVVWRNSIYNALLHVTEVSRINGSITYADAFGSYSSGTCTYKLLGYPQQYISPVASYIISAVYGLSEVSLLSSTYH